MGDLTRLLARIKYWWGGFVDLGRRRGGISTRLWQLMGTILSRCMLVGVKKCLRGLVSFVWTAFWEHIFTTINLQVLGRQLVNRSYMCKAFEETPSHLLMHCQVAKEAWNFIFTIFGVNWVVPDSIALFIKSWKFPSLRGRRRTFWKLAPLIFIYFWWFGRQEIEGVLRDIEEDVIRLKSKFWVLFFRGLKCLILV